MHELSIAENLVKIVQEEARAAKATKVLRVYLQIGSLATIEPESLSFCFDIVTKDTSLEGAELIIDKIAAKARCLACTSLFELQQYGDACTTCGEFRFEILSGKDMKISNIEVDT